MTAVTLTAGSFGSYRGYAKSGSPTGLGPIGSISGQPLSGFILDSLTTGPSNELWFEGNTTGVAFALTVDGVVWPKSAGSFGGGYTSYSVTPPAGFTGGSTYTIDCKGYEGPAWVSATSGAAGNITFASSGRAAGDDLYIVQTSANQALTTPTGFTELPTVSPQSRGTAAAAGGIRLGVYKKVSDGTEGSVTITNPGNHVYAVGFVVRPASGQSIAIEAADGNTAAAATTHSAGGVTTGVGDCLVINIYGTDRDSAGPSYSGQANASLTNVTERFDAGTTNGVGSGIMIATGEKTAAGSVSATTATSAASVAYAWITLALKNTTGGGGTTLTSTNLATTAPAIGQSTINQTRVLTSLALSTSAPAIAAASIAQVHSLTAQNLSTTAPALSQSTLTAGASEVALTSQNVTTSGAAISNAALGQLHALATTALATGSPSISASALSQMHALSAAGIATGAPSIGQATATVGISLTAQGIATAAPAISLASAEPSTLLTTLAITTSAPAIAQATITQANALASLGIATLPPVIGSAVLSQRNALVALPVSTPAAQIAPASLAQVHALTAQHVVTSGPSISPPTLVQASALISQAVVTGLPFLGSAELSTLVRPPDFLNCRFAPVEARIRVVAVEHRERIVPVEPRAPRIVPVEPRGPRIVPAEPRTRIVPVEARIRIVPVEPTCRLRSAA